MFVGRVTLIALALFGSTSGRSDAYRFFAYPSGTGSAAAPRWRARDLPLRFHLDRNSFPGEAHHWDGFKDYVGRAVAAWNELPTSSVEIVLMEGAAATVRDANDGFNWIGFGTDPFGAASASPVMRADEATGDRYMSDCDIVFPSPTQIDDGYYDNRSINSMVHEIGHCLGLAHSETHPGNGLEDSFFLPGPFTDGSLEITERSLNPGGPAPFMGASSVWPSDPWMAYGWDYGEGLPVDDAVAVSLLYPRLGYGVAQGRVAGRLTHGGEPVSLAYVQAFYFRPELQAGPGVFAGDDGRFLLEGIEPGHAVLWVRPMSARGITAHPELIGDAFAGGSFSMVDSWLNVEVQAGQKLQLPEIEVTLGRPSNPE